MKRPQDLYRLLSIPLHLSQCEPVDIVCPVYLSDLSNATALVALLQSRAQGFGISSYALSKSHVRFPSTMSPPFTLPKSGLSEKTSR